MFSTEKFWNEKFKNEDYFYGTEPNQFLKSFAYLFKPNAKVLSLGDGEGRNTVFLAKKGLDVTASDASSIGLKKLERLAENEKARVNTRYEDIVSGDWDNLKWDGIINIFCHLPKDQRFTIYSKIKNSLNPNGIFITEMFSVDQLKYKSGGPADLDMLLNLKEFNEFFNDFKVIYASSELTELNEGRHQGIGSVIRFVSQKK